MILALTLTLPTWALWFALALWPWLLVPVVRVAVDIERARKETNGWRP